MKIKDYRGLVKSNTTGANIHRVNTDLCCLTNCLYLYKILSVVEHPDPECSTEKEKEDLKKDAMEYINKINKATGILGDFQSLLESVE